SRYASRAEAAYASIITDTIGTGATITGFIRAGQISNIVHTHLSHKCQTVGTQHTIKELDIGHLCLPYIVLVPAFGQFTVQILGTTSLFRSTYIIQTAPGHTVTGQNQLEGAPLQRQIRLVAQLTGDGRTVRRAGSKADTHNLDIFRVSNLIQRTVSVVGRIRIHRCSATWRTTQCTQTILVGYRTADIRHTAMDIHVVETELGTTEQVGIGTQGQTKLTVILRFIICQTLRNGRYTGRQRNTQSNFSITEGQQSTLVSFTTQNNRATAIGNEVDG